ncbi:SDR family NAD(P)-dependent oxidoreductase [Chryseobacterium sp. RP-3-3]|uniref:SDR family NAD(P)-dependent oxidoreductase n=1 Tax=Chryseobacterium antibioticum TaxID=2728847 RepID=A0A7Y0AKI6_9FLAO|nr:SDR family NAD(P)-dependent oxidoreductase [Chryseobacterium antibioticum]NML68959.1 SDR family NAD(P)-dependent oxidoreductase [Chryseobacterium antibioticum]
MKTVVKEFQSKFTGSETFLSDHVVQGTKILPGVAYLELARFGGEYILEKQVTGLRDVVWMRPISIQNEPVDVVTGYTEDVSGITYEISSQSSGTKEIHSQGHVYTGILPTPRTIDLNAVRMSCTQVVSADQSYNSFRNRGLFYGFTFQGIKEMHCSETRAVSQIILPREDGFVLSPGMLDSALQTCMGIGFVPEGGSLELPFSLRELNIYGALPETVWCYTEVTNPKARLKEYAIYLCDDSGKVFVSLIGFSALTLAVEKPAVSQEQPDPVSVASETGTMSYYQSTWKQENLVPDADTSSSSADTIVLVDASEELTASVSQFLNLKVLCLSSSSPIDLFEGVKNEILKSITSKSPLNLTVAGFTSRYHSFGFLRGLIKSAEQECSWFTGRILGVEDFSAPEKWVEILKTELKTASKEISYQGGVRSVRMLRSVDLADNHGISFRPEGVYLITGGFGGLGIQFAHHISRNYPTATIILSGRRTANEIQRQILSDQPSWRYIQTDVSDAVSVERLISQIKKEYGQLTGIIHAAGVLRDSLLVHKTHEEIKAVFGPKISGIMHLDEATKEESLDFMVNFSSVSAVLGNIGQSDYASANAYLNDYTHYRNILVERGERHGQTLSINWPLWRSGGMQIDESSEQYLKRHWGMEPLPTNLGIEAFDAILKNGLNPILVLFGEQQKIIKKILLDNITATIDEETQIAGMNIEVLINQLKEICAKLLKLNISDLDAESHLSDYGLDSIIMMKLLTVLEETYDCVLDPTMVIQHPSIGELAAYLVDNKLVAVEETPQKNAVMDPQVLVTSDKQFNSHTTSGVAIIGISCNFPESENTEELWENLKNGRDLISEVPVNRSFRKGYYNQTKTNSTSYSNKGGFMKNPAAFDIQYFKIKPEEAIAMDPQQRIVLELTRDLLASSGFEKEELAGTNTGVFIGAKDNNYIRNGYDLLPEGTHQHVIVNSISNMIAARVSDFYDLKGASQVIDTACSSSLVAIHQAYEAILSGKLNMAIAGGISVMVDEYGHIGFSQANVLSADGKSCVFDERANGFVLGEGGGLVLLKDYGQALLDGDRILAVVQGSAVNNDGKTMGVTVPNKQGQKAVIAEALAKSGVNPDQISYYEAHGTGTLLGDPIEINAASEVYQQQTDKTGFCAIGSVKSNLGHTMTAAGVTGLIKIILQMQHSELVPTIHCEKPHPRFKFNESPFYPITIYKKWDVQQKVAAISSFGFGGTNCHLILSEATQDKMSWKRTPLKVQRQSENYWLGYTDPAVFEKEAVTSKTIVGMMPLTSGLENEIVRLIRDKISQKTNIQPADILVDEGFMDLGLDSTVLIQLTSELGDEWNIELYPTLLFQYDTIRKFAAHIAATYSSELAHLQYKEPLAAPVTETEEPKEIKPEKQLTEIPVAFEDEIAIIGMTARFPGAETLENYWENILKRKDLITEIPEDRWIWETYYGDEKKERGKTKAKFGGFISDIDKFDCKFFRVLPLEAQLMDPQHRITIEGVYHLFEHAGIAPEQMKGTDTGVFIGVSSADYATLINKEKGLNQYAQYATGNTHSVLVNRISYLFDLHGPSIPIDTACSSSLIAISRAVESIRSGNCSMAVAGGVNIILSPELTLSFSQAGMLSKDGRCKTFDKKANGYVRSEGMGLILLKSKVAAERDGDHIYGIIKSVAENHGGKVSTLTSPNPNAQRNLIIQAIQKAGLHPNDISYIEAHGTGTPLGDPIETEALKMAFEELEGDSPLKQSNCALGSVKATIGHLEAAAGIAGVIKTLLCMNHQTLGGNPHLKEPNELLKLNNSPFRLVKETENWESANQQVRTAGVSSFGFGGANAHVILQEYAGSAAKKLEPGKTLICLSAKTESQLLTIQKNLFAFLQKNSDCSLHDIAQTLLVGRDAMLIRAALVTDSPDDLKQQLEQVILGKQSAFVSGMADMKTFNEQDTVIAVRRNLQASNEWESVMHSWLKGQPVNWKQFYNSAEVRRIELPGYPFLRERFWYTEIQEINTPKESYSKEFLLVDHVVGNEIGIEEFGNGIVMVKMQSRETKNMLDDHLIKSLTKTFSELEQRADLKVVILTGYDNVFCMGGSQDILNGIANKKQKYTDAPFVYKGLLEFKVPVITAIQGMAVGGGLIFGLYGDIVYMDERSTYSSNFMKYGFTPGMGATYIMPKKLGQQLAQEMMYTARLIGGNELRERAATVKITGDVLKEAIRTAKELASKPKIALEVLKRNLSDRMLQDLQQHVREELEMHDKTFHTDEVRNLITATFNRPAPVNPENKNTIVPIHSKVKLEHPDTVAAKGVKPFISEPFRKVSLCDVGQSDFISELKPITQPVSVESKREEEEIKADQQQAIMQSGSIIGFLKDCAAALLNLPANEIGAEDIFLDMGIDSISGVEFIRSVNDKFDLQLEAVLLYDYPNINALSAFIEKNSTTVILDMPKKELVQLLAEPMVLPLQKEHVQHNTEDVTDMLKQIFGRMLNLPVEELSINESFIDFGVDSISGVEAVRAINEQFDLSLETVILYDYFNIGKLANFIAGQLPEKTRIMAEPYYTPVKESVALAEEKQQQISATDIAIIGISGRFPQADNVDEFWTNLASGKDSVTEVPERKWSIADIYSKERGLAGKSYGKWMGAINDEDKFDAYFFNISPAEAKKMDPQQRVFLQEVWKTFEDAGYSPESLSESACGVFVGVGPGDYFDRFKKNELLDNHVLTGVTTSMLASRISYLLNLQGPAIAIDTACSSSLVALHQACSSLRNGECEMAIAGGVNIMTTESMHILTSKTEMLSEDGKCHTFDNQANGFVPGEAVGVVLLKPLHQAINDKDNIYAVIKGSAVNQDGKTNGIMAPSANSQKKLIQQVLNRFDIDPGSISYVETHGTGTKLGDPIEIKALKEVYSGKNFKPESCALGSVKTNIGHALTAAGISSLLKVVLSMKNKQIPPSLHYNQCNEHIQLNGTSFYVNTKLNEWKLPDSRVRRAAVSSFGYSGTNSHIVLEAFEQLPETEVQDQERLFLFSAKNKERLVETVKLYCEFLQEKRNLNNVSYTLLTGREAMPERLAIVAVTQSDLLGTLQEYLKGTGANYATGNIKSQVIHQQALQATDQRLQEIINSWLKGQSVNAESLFGEENPEKISLPTYPFEKERHWVDIVYAKPIEAVVNTPLNEWIYKTTIAPDSPLLNDHKVQGRKIIPGVYYLQIVKEAMKQGFRLEVNRFRNVQLLDPGYIGQEPLIFQVEIKRNDQEFEYRITTEEHGQTKVKSQGFTSFSTEQPTVLRRGEEQCKLLSFTLESSEFYQQLASMGLEYGPLFNGLKKLYFNENEAWAYSEKIENQSEESVLGQLDSCFQTCLGIDNNNFTLKLPFGIENLLLYRSMPEKVWTYARKERDVQGKTVFTVEIYDEEGFCLAKAQKVTVFPIIHGAASKPQIVENRKKHLYIPKWNRIKTGKGLVQPILSNGQHLIIGQQTDRNLSNSLTLYLKDKGIIPLHLDTLDHAPEGVVQVYLLHGLQSAYNHEDSLEQMEYTVFRAIKMLQESNFNQKKIELTVLTRNTQKVLDTDTVNPKGSGIVGIIGSLAKEQPGWVIRMIDLGTETTWNWDTLMSYSSNKDGAVVAYRNGFLFRSELRPLDQHAAVSSKLKQSGVYLLLGGAGGIGRVTSDYLMKQYNAKVIWLGRREMDSELEKAIHSVGTPSNRPEYFQCDATKKNEVGDIHKLFLERGLQINGIFHSAIVLNDRLIKNMKEQSFKMAFEPKSLATQNLFEIFKRETLDFICFYSSIQSQINAAGQSNYSAGCTYKDSYAHALQQQWKKTPVYIINWGYWGDVGIVSTDEYRAKLAASGLGSINAKEGMQILEQILAGEQKQLAAIKFLN